MNKGIFITLVIMDVIALIVSIIGIATCYVEAGRSNPLPWCLLLSWAIIGIIKDGLIYRGSEITITSQKGINQIDNELKK